MIRIQYLYRVLVSDMVSDMMAVDIVVHMAVAVQDMEAVVVALDSSRWQVFVVAHKYSVDMDMPVPLLPILLLRLPAEMCSTM
jgi:hypothetical protein